MDIVGYSKRAIEVQVQLIVVRDRLTLATLEALEVSAEERVLTHLGDGLYIGLSTSTARFDIHLRLVLEILRRLAEHNEQADDRERFELRFGIDESTDDLITDINGQPNVAGVGANMAARIINWADGGQVLVSQSVHKQLYMREYYAGNFRELPPVVVKHGERLQIFQYSQEGLAGLDCSVPAKWHEDLANQGKAASNLIIHPISEAKSLKSQQADTPPAAADLNESQGSKSLIAEQQIRESVEALSDAVMDGNFASGLRFSNTLDDFQLLRLSLLTTTWQQTQLSTAALDNHEANRVYLSRERLHPSRPESFALLRMLVGDSNGYVPGWYWHREFEEPIIERVILHLAITDYLASLRQEAFDLLSAARIQLPEAADEAIALTIKSDSVADVRRAAVAYLGQIGSERHLPVVGSALVDAVDTVSRQARQSKYLILARNNPDRAWRELLTESGVGLDEILTELRPRITEITSVVLNSGLKDSNDEIRLLAVRELSRRGEFTVETATSLKEDKSDHIKADAYAFLIQRGVPFESDEITFKVPNDPLRRWTSRKLFSKREPSIDREGIVLSYYRRFSVDQLLQMSEWSQWGGHDAYRALAVDHFDVASDKLRADLNSDFAEASKPYFEHELAEWQRIARLTPSDSMSASLSRSIFRNWLHDKERKPEDSASSSVETRKQQYVAAALAGLARHGGNGDIEFGRRFLFHAETDVRIEAVKVIRRCGTADDVADLIKVATTSDALLQELAAKAAFRLANDSLRVAAEFLDTSDDVLASIAIAELILRGDTDSTGAFLEPYLDKANENIRTRAITFFAIRYGREDLENLLARYSGRPTYFYDVVCCFDRVLYAPQHLASFYLARLKDQFFGFLESED